MLRAKLDLLRLGSPVSIGVPLHDKVLMDFVGIAKPLSRSGFGSALRTMGLEGGEGALVWAVLEVETAGVTQGCGFTRDRRPQMLFERHKFREFTKGQFDSKAPDISGSPGAYGPLASQYDRLAKAIQLCEEAGLGTEPALRAASWGLGQVMGFNFSPAGFASAVDLVSAATNGEDDQLAQMGKFAASQGLGEALRRRDWAGFAKRYNGPKYHENKYDIKLESQYQRFAGGTLPNLEVRAAQVALLYLGFEPGKIDGVLGGRTHQALKSFRIQQGLGTSDDLDGDVYSALMKAAGLA